VSIRLYKESLDLEGVKIFEKKEDTNTFSALAFQRETTIFLVDLVIPVNPVVPVVPMAPVDIPRDIAVGHKRPAWARQTLQEVESHPAESHAAPQGTS
jgi:hypothetical protein